MNIYKNHSHSVKTFHGVTFKPGETKEVPGVINHPLFVKQEKLPDSLPKESKAKSTINKTTNEPEESAESIEDEGGK